MGKRTLSKMPLESDDAKAVWDWRKAMIGQHPELEMLYHTPNERRTKITGIVWLMARGFQPGLPDWNLDVARHGFHGLRIEQKRKHEKLSTKQAAWLDRFNRNGYMAVICVGADAVIQTIADYCGIRSGL